jgi:ParB/RepB/Spo0J family partition protein
VSEKIMSIRIDKLIAHPDNPNSMSDSTFRKLVRNIERTGLYEPIVVRIHPHRKNNFEIINGHHRVKALKQLGRKEADCVVWDVDDEQTAVLLTTLNRLAGSDIPARKIELLKKLTERMGTAQLAKLLPQTAKQIERLANLKLSAGRCSLHAEQFAIPLVFFVTKQQQGVIEEALSIAEHRVSSIENQVSSIENRVSSVDMTKAQCRAEALTQMASELLEGKKSGLQQGATLV